MKSLIGKYYYPCDNSYCVNLTSSSNYPYKNNANDAFLAGTLVGHEPKKCIIVSEPFDCVVKEIIDGVKTVKMIIVNYNGNSYSTMFFSDCVVI